MTRRPRTPEEHAAHLAALHEKRTDRNRRITSVELSAGDKEMVREIEERLGVRKSEAIRTSIRVYHAILFRGIKQ